MAEPIRSDEIQALRVLLEQAAGEGPAGFTSRDISRSLGCSSSRAQGKLREWADRGLIEYAGQRRIRRIDGAMASAPVYRLTKKAAQKRPRRNP